MKRIIIIALAVILLLVGGVWLYLMLYGTPDSPDDIFANLGFNSVPAPVEPVAPTPEPLPVVEREPEVTEDESFFQVSTVPSIGAMVYGSGTPTVRFTEQGTGAIYEVDIATMDERKISDTIFQGLTEAIWSPDGQQVVLVKEATFDREVTLFAVTGEASLVPEDGTVLPPDARNIAFSDNTTLHYTRSDREGTLGYLFNTETKADSVLFSVPFSYISVQWQDEPVIFNRPSELHPGYAYRVKSGNQLESIGAGGTGLVAFAAGDKVALSKKDDRGDFVGYISDEDGTPLELSIPLLPEKCAAIDNQPVAWCTYPLYNFRADMPEDWYKGIVTLSDELWLVNLEDQSTSLAVALSSESKMRFDVQHITTSTGGAWTTFITKLNNSLWLYDFTK